MTLPHTFEPQVSPTPAPGSLRETIETALAQAVQPMAGCPQRLTEAMQYCLLAPGKRLRPQLVLLSAQACGGSVAGAMPAAVAVELIHTYSLVHDDLPAMDDDDLRRGRATCHRQFDEATAILVGDALLTRAFEVLATGLRPAERAAACCGELAQAAGAAALVGGQADDLAAEHRRLDLAQVQSIHERKTGALFRVALRLGALAAGGTPVQAESLGRYGDRLGLAFQIVDDLLDVAGNEQLVGKRLGQDQRHGKATYVSLVGEEVSRQLVDQLISEAVAALEPLGDAATPLVELAEFVRGRNN
jgi:geranylgeranyl diphosphate synthase type II